jgi:hypothetical protein
MAITSEQYYSFIVYGLDGAAGSPVDQLYFDEGPYIDLNEYININPLLHWTDEYDYYHNASSHTLFIHAEVEDTTAVKIIFSKSADTYDYTLRWYDKENNPVGGINTGLPQSTYHEMTTNPLDPTPPPLSGADIFFIFSAHINGNGEYSVGAGLVWPMNPAWQALHPASKNYIYAGQMLAQPLEAILVAWQENMLPWDSKGAAPYGEAEGGGGLYNRPDYEITIPSLPSYSICDSGFCGIYHVTSAMLQALATFMWDPSFYSSIIKNYESPMENIVNLAICPMLSFTETADTIKIGNMDSNISASKLDTSFYEIDCGNVSVPEVYKTYADYYTNIELFLPYIGKTSIPVDDVMNGDKGIINVVYHVDVFSGACTAFVRCYTGRAWHVLQQHQGNILSNLPLSGANYMGVYSGMLRAASSIMTGNVMGAIESGLNAKPSFSRTGSVGSTSGLMGIQYPYLIFTTPKYIVAEKFRELKGHKSNLQVTIGDETGFLSAEVTNDDLIDFDCTVEELEMVAQKLREGIRLGS